MSYRLPLWSTVVIFIQMVMGGIIVGEDAGFVCPDWPLCHGQVMPKLSGLVLLELVHRLSALLVLVFVLINVGIVLKRYRHDRAMVRVIVLALASLMLQVIVGGLIVLLKLPGITTTIDVMNSMLLLGLFVYFTMLVRQRSEVQERLNSAEKERIHGLQTPAHYTLAAGAFAILMGALFRHTGASQALFGQDSYLLSHGQHTPPSMVSSVALMSIHIFSGVLLGVASVVLFTTAIRVGRMVKMSGVLVLLVIIQAALGMASLQSQLGLIVSTAHWANAGLLAIVMVWIAAKIWLNQPTEVDSMQSAIRLGDHGTAPS